MTGPTGFDEKSLAETGGAPPPPAAGDAGNSFLAFINNMDFTDKAKAEAVNQSAHQLKDLAKSGGFGINEEGMREYLKLCDMFLDGYGELRQDARGLTIAAPLGNDDYATKVAEFNVKVANADDRSLIPNMELMKDTYEQLKKAFVLARKNYDQMEDEQAQRFGQAKTE